MGNFKPIHTRPPTDAYREGWDRCFGKKEEPELPEKCEDCERYGCEPGCGCPDCKYGGLNDA